MSARPYRRIIALAYVSMNFLIFSCQWELRERSHLISISRCDVSQELLETHHVFEFFHTPQKKIDDHSTLEAFLFDHHGRTIDTSRYAFTTKACLSVAKTQNLKRLSIYNRETKAFTTHQLEDRDLSPHIHTVIVNEQIHENFLYQQAICDLKAEDLAQDHIYYQLQFPDEILPSDQLDVTFTSNDFTPPGRRAIKLLGNHCLALSKELEGTITIRNEHLYGRWQHNGKWLHTQAAGDACQKVHPILLTVSGQKQCETQGYHYSWDAGQCRVKTFKEFCEDKNAPQEIKEALVALRYISYSKESASCQLFEENLKEVKTLDLSLKNLYPLYYFTHFTSAKLSSEELSDLEPLKNWTNLRALKIEKTIVSDASPLIHLKNLASLSLIASFITDLSFLKALPQLKNLTLHSLNLSNIKPLAQLPELVTLDLSFTPVEDISPLRGLNKLVRLNLRHSSVKDLRPLEDLTQLRHLFINGTLVSDITSLRQLANLEVLFLRDSEVLDLSPLANFHQLRVLSALNTRINDLGPLKELYELEHLSVGKSQVADLQALKDLYKLKVLHIGDSLVKDLSPLANMQQLEILFMQNLSILDTSYLANLNQLQRLCMHGSVIPDYQPLLGLALLKDIGLPKNFQSEIRRAFGDDKTHDECGER